LVPAAITASTTPTEVVTSAQARSRHKGRNVRGLGGETSDQADDAVATAVELEALRFQAGQHVLVKSSEHFVRVDRIQQFRDAAAPKASGQFRRMRVGRARQIEP
jgi:hypothetical protein